MTGCALAVERARLTGAPAVFWLDRNRAHDAQLIAKVDAYLADHDTDGLTIETMAPTEAATYSIERARNGEDTISVTGNVLRDYLTDLFPILELGTSAKMLSVVPLLAGGGLFETGAGGLCAEARAAAGEGELPALGQPGRVPRSGGCLRDARAANRQRQRSHSGRDTRCSDRHVVDRTQVAYAAARWARQPRQPLLPGAVLGAGTRLRRPTTLRWPERFAPLAAALAENEEAIVAELNGVQGDPVDLGGYYRPDPAKAEPAMRPSATLNAAIDTF